MNFTVLGLFAGIVSVQQWARLPGAWEWLAIILMAFLFGYRRWRLACYFMLGVIWASVYAGWRLSDRLSDEWQGKDVAVQGYILSLPKHQDRRISFDFIVTQAPQGIPGKLRLNWYSSKVSVQAGQRWDMTLRLKKPHGRGNPGGFDYEAWLFAHHIGATGYVRPKPVPRLLEPHATIASNLARWRQTISDGLDVALPNSDSLGVIKALSIGSQDAISRRQWDLFRATGIVHLMVISGTHISLLAGLVFLGAKRLWVWSGILAISPQVAAALTAWTAAVFYTALAGFSIPTQRALLMLTVGLWAIVWQRNTAPMQVLQIALLSVVLFDPLSPLSLGFWLSFAAVALLIYISSGRLGKAGYWREVSKLHLAMALGLSPLLIVFFQQVSVVAPLANWVAVPVVGLLLTPLALSAAFTAVFAPSVASLLLWPADKILQGLSWLLQQMAAWTLATVSCQPPPWYALMFAGLGVLLLLAPKGMPSRYLGPFLLLPIFFVDVDKPKPGQIWFTLLDIGQGLAAVVQTESHVLVYDTGPKYSQQSDMGEAVVLPFLRHRGINRVDSLVISHGENDHSGGAASVMAGVQVDEVYSSASDWAEQAVGRYCKAGQNWQWDGVDFEILSPGNRSFNSENNNSCVLKVTAAQHGLLLTGDIESEAEQWLVDRYGTDLASSVLIAPHHGSKTSSHRYFLDRVKPKLVLISAGYLNRFGFPHRLVLSRYRERKIESRTTAEQGAITVKFGSGAMQVQAWRQRHKRYWMDGNTND